MMGETMKHLHRIGIWPPLLAVLLQSGCATVDRTFRWEDEERREIKGTERFELDVGSIQRKPLNENEKLEVIPKQIVRRFKRERWYLSWYDVERRRYVAVAGVHGDYDFGSDIGELILSPFLVLAGLFNSGPDYGSEFGGAILSILPFITWNDSPVKPETVKKEYNERLKKSNPYLRSDNLTARPHLLNGKRIYWTATDAAGKKRGDGKVAWPNPILLPWTSWVLKDPANPRFYIRLTSPDMDLKGTTVRELEVALRDAVLRKWPDPGDRPQANLEIQEIQLENSLGKPEQELFTGRTVNLTMKVKNGFWADPGYLLRPVVELRSGPALAVGDATEVPCLDARTEVKLKVPLGVPLEDAGGPAVLSVSLVDAFGRKSPPVAYRFNVRQTQLPKLNVYEAEIKAGEKGEHMLDVVLRNAGHGKALKVEVSLSGESGVAFRETRRTVPSLEPGERANVKFALSRPPAADQSTAKIRFGLSHDLNGTKETVEDVVVPVVR